MVKYLCLSLLLILYACNNNTSKVTKNDNIKISNQGVDIYYEDSKVGDTVLFFIHGWGINHTYWVNQVAYFSKKYRVITIDLPGFGLSGKNRNSWTVEDFAKDINAVMTALDLKNVVLIGHSMSGAIAVETASTYPSRIVGVVGVDNLKDIDIKLTPEIEKEWAAVYESQRKNFKVEVPKVITGLFSPSTDSLIRKRVMEDILSSEPGIAVDCVENLDKYNFVKKLKHLSIPLYLINSSYQPTDTLTFKKKNIQYHLLDIGPTGHYPMLEKPSEFNLLLAQAINGIK